jgi:hypothetical protein
MPKSADHKKPRKNATEERLRATPFDDIARLESEETQIRLAAWQRMTATKVFHELLTKPEFQDTKKELKAGLRCNMGNESEDHVYHVFSEGVGLNLVLNESYLETLGEQKASVIQAAVQAGVAGWGSLFWQAKGILPKASDPKIDGMKPDSGK